ncbi:MAG: aminopeptidase YwaD [Halobacteriales archaeon]|jgi:aminopeptidase YwaD
MSRFPTSVVGDAYTSTRHWELLETLVDLDDRMPGHEGERLGAELVRDAFADAGLRDVGIEEFEIPGWWRESSSLTVDHDRRHVFDEDYQLLALPGSPGGTVEAELVDVGHGLPEDFEEADLEGKIAVASSATPETQDRWIHRAEKYHFAVDQGAAGFVFRNHVEGCLPPTGTTGRKRGPGPIPAVGVSKEVGDRLVRYSSDRSPAATLEVDARNEPATSRNVEGAIGPDTEREVLLTAHVDAHDVGEGANDNGVGTVLVGEVARLLAGIEDDLDTAVRFVVFGAEEIGLYGSSHWVDTHPNEAVKAVVNLDSVGYSRTLKVHTHRFDAIGAAFEETAEELAVPVEVVDTIKPHSDHWPFVEEGIPGVEGQAVRDESGRGWGHTHADTLDKLDVRDLRDLAVVLASAILKLADADRTIEHESREEIRQASVEDGHEEWMRNMDVWPFEDPE